MTPEERALRDAFLTECWRPCPELSREDREVKRALDAAFAQPVERVVHKSTGPRPAQKPAQCA